MDIRVKSTYAQRGPEDGYRILVDDYLPDSMDEQRAGVDLWLRDIMPGKGLASLLENNPDMWDEFKARYFKELEGSKHYWVETIANSSRDGDVTLCFSSSDHERNNAVAIREYITQNIGRLGLKAA